MATKPKPYAPPELLSDPDLVDRIFAYILSELPDLHERVVALKNEVRAEFRGEECYIAGTPASDRQLRVQQVLALFNGRNASEVARRLQISRSTVYRIIKQPGGIKKPSHFS